MRSSGALSTPLSTLSRSALALLAAAVYLVAAVSPCPAAPTPVAGSAHAHHAADASGGDTSEDDASASLSAPCLCGCEEGPGGFGSSKRLEPAMPPEPPARLENAPTTWSEVARRLPDAPISPDSPVPILSTRRA